MSKSTVVLNGENTSEVGDFTTDANVNMVAAINDHSCAKHLETYNSKENKVGILPFPCEFDHMYASKMSEIVNNQGTNPEINHLKELLLLHLDLIQQQSEQLVTKDKQITAVLQENEMLKQRLERMDRRVSLHKQKELSEVPVSPNPPIITFSSSDPVVGEIPLPPPISSVLPITCTPVLSTQADSLNLENSIVGSDNTPSLCGKRKRDDGSSVVDSAGTYAVNKTSSGNLSAVCSETITVNKRKRSASWTSSLPSTDITSSLSKVNGKGISNETPNKDVKKRKRGRPKLVITEPVVPKKEESVLMTDKAYFTTVGEDDSPWCSTEEPQINGHFLEVPSWRLRVFTSCYSMEGTENLSDDVFDRRHSRLEIDERRRKRWDVQRIREQRQVEKLKQRQKRRSSNISGLVSLACASPAAPDSDEEELVSLWPAPEDADYLVVDDMLPVSAFGFPITKFGGTIDTPTEFTLPWMNEKQMPKGKSGRGRRKR